MEDSHATATLIEEPNLVSTVRTWPALWAVALLGILLSVLYAAILRDLVAQWWDDANYSHGFIVPIFSGYLVWQRRAQVRASLGEGSWWGLPVLIAGVLTLVLGQIAAENFLGRSSLIVILVGLLWLHCGWPTVRALSFPIGFLLFMIPLPATIFYAVAFPLQRIAAQNAAWALEALGIPVLLDGNIIQLSQITLGVTEACSGIRSLISLLALAVAWAYLTLPGALGMLLLAAAAVPITIVANAVRIVSTGLVGQWFGFQYAEGFFHTFSGWIIFVFAFLCLLALHGLIRLAIGLFRRAA